MKTKQEDDVWTADSTYHYYCKEDGNLLLSVTPVKGGYEAKRLVKKTRKVKTKIFNNIEDALNWCYKS